MSVVPERAKCHTSQPSQEYSTSNAATDVPRGKGKGKISASPPSSDDVPGSGRRRQWQWARSADWDVHRGRITELYRDRGLHLDQVIDTMAREYGFYASPRMYKTRISKWAIDKNYKAADVACMLLLKRRRAAEGKASSFILRGRKVDWAKIEQYLKRDSTLLRRLEAGDDLLDLVPGHIQNSGIICRTPSPTPSPSPMPRPPLLQRQQEQHAHYLRQHPPPAVLPSQADISVVVPSSPLPSFHQHHHPNTPHPHLIIPSQQPLTVPGSYSAKTNHPPLPYIPATANQHMHRHMSVPTIAAPTVLGSSSSESSSSSSSSSNRSGHYMSGGRHHSIHIPQATGPSYASIPSYGTAFVASPTSAAAAEPFQQLHPSFFAPPAVPAPTIPRMPAAPLDVRLPEEIVRLTRDYCLAAFDQGLWVTAAAADDRNPTTAGHYTSARAGPAGSASLQAWGRRLRRAQHLIGAGRHDEGFGAVGHCMDALRQLVQDEDPLLLFHLLGNTATAHTPHLRELAATLCGHTRELARIVLGAAHPITRVFDRLDAVAATDAHFEVLPLPLRCLVELFEARAAAASTTGSSSSSAVDPAIDHLCARFAQLLRCSSGNGTAASSPTTKLGSPTGAFGFPPPATAIAATSSSSSSPITGASTTTTTALHGSISPLGTLTAAASVELQQILDYFEHTRNTHTKLRFYHTYLAYLAELALTANDPTSAASACPGEPREYLAYDGIAASSDGSRTGSSSASSSSTASPIHQQATPSTVLFSPTQIANAASEAIAAAAPSASATAGFASAPTWHPMHHKDLSNPTITTTTTTATLTMAAGSSAGPAPGSSPYAMIAAAATTTATSRKSVITLREPRHYYIFNVHIADEAATTAGEAAVLLAAAGAASTTSSTSAPNTPLAAALSSAVMPDGGTGAGGSHAPTALPLSLTKELEDIIGMDQWA